MNTTEKKLTRSASDKKVAGVCSGLAHYFGMDPTVTRVGFIVTTLFTGGAAALAYVAMMFVMPTDEQGMTHHDPLASL